MSQVDTRNSAIGAAVPQLEETAKRAADDAQHVRNGDARFDQVIDVSEDDSELIMGLDLMRHLIDGSTCESPPDRR